MERRVANSIRPFCDWMTIWWLAGLGIYIKPTIAVYQFIYAHNGDRVHAFHTKTIHPISK